MKIVKRIVKVAVNSTGKKVFVMHGVHPEWIEYANALNDGDIVKQTMRKINEYDKRREYHFAYLDRFVHNCHEEFSNQIYGKTDRDKMYTLDYTLRDKYCELHPECYIHSFNALTGKDTVYPFSLSDSECDLNEEQKDDFYKWSKEFLYELHKQKYEIEIPYWID